MTAGRRAAGVLASCGALGLVAPATVGAHSIVRASSTEMSYTSSDATSLNTLSVDIVGSDVHVRDPTVDGGIDYGSCRPGDVDANGYVIEAFCPRGSIGLLRVDLGEREDTATLQVPFRTQVVGGAGADKLTGGDQADTFVGGDGDDVLDGAGGDDVLNGGDGADTVTGGAGSDRLQLGLGADTADGGAGDDLLQSRDGVIDTVRCGDGLDVVEADQLDTVPEDGGCEQVKRTQVTPPGGAAAAEPDRTAPVVRAGAAVRQRLRPRLTLAAASSEAGAIAASGFLVVGDQQLPLQARRVPNAVAGGGVRLIVRLSARERRLARSALRRGRRVTARLEVVATDAAGNSAKVRAPAIRLVR